MLPVPLPGQKVGDRTMECVAVHHRRRRQDRDPQHVREAIAERAAAVVVDLGVRDRQDVVGTEPRERTVNFSWGGGEPLKLVVCREPDALRLGSPAEGLADEPARPVPARAAVVRGAGEEERILGPGHRHVREAPLFGDVPVAIRNGGPGEARREPQLGQTQAPG